MTQEITYSNTKCNLQKTISKNIKKQQQQKSTSFPIFLMTLSKFFPKFQTKEIPHTNKRMALFQKHINHKIIICTRNHNFHQLLKILS